MKDGFDRRLPEAGRDNERPPQDSQAIETKPNGQKITRYPDGTVVRTNYNEETRKITSITSRRPGGPDTIEINGIEAEVDPNTLKLG